VVECVIFSILHLGFTIPTQVVSTQHSTPPPSGEGENFPPIIGLQTLSRRDVIFLQAVMDYAFSRVDDMACSPGMVAFSDNGYRSQQHWVTPWQAGGTVRVSMSTHLSVFWGNPTTFRTCSAVLCMEFLFFGERTKGGGKKKKKGEKLLLSDYSKQLPASLQCLVFWDYYMP
jgi:hypothetical protein